MINVVNTKIETPINLTNEKPALLIVENPHEYFNFVVQMLKAMQGEMSEFTFWEGQTALSPLKCGEIIQSCFSFDFTDKKIINLLYKKLQSNFQEGEFILQLNKINSLLSIFLQDLCQTVDFAIDFSETTVEDILKTCSVKPACNYDGLLEKIICYVNMFIQLKNIKFFVFVGLKDVLSDEDLEELYKHCELQKVSLLLIESGKKRPLLCREQAIIITEDLCEILENYTEI